MVIILHRTYPRLEPCHIVAFAAGVTAFVASAFSAVLGQVAGNVGIDASSSLQVGTGLVGISGLIIAIGGLMKPFWDDRQRKREMEERSEARRLQLERNNYITRQMHDWIVKAAQKYPDLPEPPKWVKLNEEGSLDQDSRR